MSDGVIALIAVGSVFAYAMIAGVTWALCPLEADHPGRATCAAFWPIALPAVIGAALVRWIKAPRAAKLPKARMVKP